MTWETLAWAKAQRTGSVGRKAVLMALAEYADERHSCFPSQETLAHDTEQSVRTIRTHITDLVEADLVTVERRGGTGAGSMGNRYVLNVTGEGNRQKLPVGQPANGGGATGNLLPPKSHREPQGAKAPAARPRDPIFDAVCLVTGTDPSTLTRSGGSNVGRVVKELKEVGATADEIKVRARRYIAKYPGASLTGPALTKHWADLGSAAPPPRARVAALPAHLDMGPRQHIPESLR
jgi:DNA-binding transcriptional ArsR family regulator